MAQPKLDLPALTVLQGGKQRREEASVEFLVFCEESAAIAQQIATLVAALPVPSLRAVQLATRWGWLAERAADEIRSLGPEAA